MKKYIIILLVSISTSIYSQDETVIEKLVLKNQKLSQQNDTLKEQQKNLKNENKDLLNKIESQSTEIKKINSEYQVIKNQLDDLKKVSYSKEEYNKALAKKDQEIEALKKEFREKEQKIQAEKTKLENEKKATLSILSEMNGTFFEKKIRDNYTQDYLKNHTFKREDSLTLKKYEAMIVSLSVDPSMSELQASKVLEKATKFNEIYFYLYESYLTFDTQYDSTKISNELKRLNNLIIPIEYEGLNKSKIEIISLLKNYCLIQQEIFEKLKKTDNIKDKNYLTSQLENIAKSEKYKNYKYLKEIIENYAKINIELPKTNCSSK
jgi:hypothetical protein